MLNNILISLVSNARITPHTLSFVKKLVSTFGIGFEPASSVSTTLSTAASESLARRAQATAQDPVFQKLKEQFTTDFDFRLVEGLLMHNEFKPYYTAVFVLLAIVAV